MINFLNPDLFSEDPKMFLGDHESYFKIVKKRSILFFYLSRLILYFTVIYIILKFILKKMKDNIIDDNRTFNKKSYKIFKYSQIITLALILIISIIIFFLVGTPK